MLDQKKNKGDFRPYLANVNVRWGSFDLSDLRAMRFERHENERYGLRYGDIVMCEGGEPGRCAIWRDQIPGMMIQKALHRIRPKPGLDNRFLYYCLSEQGRSGTFSQLFTGATIKHLPGEQLAKAEVVLPPLPIQRRISSILGAYDDLIEVNRRRIAVLEEMARRLFDEWFVHFRFPDHEGHKMVVTDQGKLPEGWTWVALGTLCERITDGSHYSPSSVDDGRLMASVKDMREWDFDLSGCRMIADDDFQALVRAGCQPKVGDIVIAKDGANLNKHTFLIYKETPIVLLSSVAILRPKPDVQPEFLVGALRSETTSAAIKLMKSGAAIPRIVLRDFKRLSIALPPPHVREKFGRAASAMHTSCRVLFTMNLNLAKQRDLLLARLISGDLSVANAERELEAAD